MSLMVWVTPSEKFRLQVLTLCFVSNEHKLDHNVTDEAAHAFKRLTFILL